MTDEQSERIATALEQIACNIAALDDRINAAVTQLSEAHASASETIKFAVSKSARELENSVVKAIDQI